MAEDHDPGGRKMTGFLDTLTDEQLKAAMEYRGEDDHPTSADEQPFETMSEQELLDGLDKIFGHMPAKLDGDPTEWGEPTFTITGSMPIQPPDRIWIGTEPRTEYVRRDISDAAIDRQAKVIARMQATMSAMAMDWPGRNVKSWNWDMSEAPRDRKICCLWKDIYSDGDEGGPKYTAGHTYWMEEGYGGLKEHWANRPSSHWRAVAWCLFPPVPNLEDRSDE